jgi:hypothetical protein
MKKLTILFLMICTLANGQINFNQPKKEFPKAAKILITMVSWSILNGIGDGLNDSGHKGWGHACNAASAAALLGGTLWSKPERGEWPIYFASAIFIRYGTFDAAYNLTRNLPFDYIGNTATIDKAMAKVPAHFRTFTKGIALTIGISIPITNFNQNKNERKRPF